MIHNNRLVYSYANVVTGINIISMASPSSQQDNLNTGITHQTEAFINTENLSIDNNPHPLFLHNNDQPGMILISNKLLGSENYSSWKRSIQISLSANNRLVIVTGEFSPPSEESALFAHRKRVNDMVINWILKTVSD